MPTVPRPPPTAERRKEQDHAHAVGQALYGGHVGLPTEGEKPLKFLDQIERWNKLAKRWQYKKGAKQKGKAVGGKFTKRPEWAK